MAGALNVMFVVFRALGARPDCVSSARRLKPRLVKTMAPYVILPSPAGAVALFRRSIWHSVALRSLCAWRKVWAARGKSAIAALEFRQWSAACDLTVGQVTCSAGRSAI